MFSFLVDSAHICHTEHAVIIIAHTVGGQLDSTVTHTHTHTHMLLLTMKTSGSFNSRLANLLGEQFLLVEARDQPLNYLLKVPCTRYQKRPGITGSYEQFHYLTHHVTTGSTSTKTRRAIRSGSQFAFHQYRVSVSHSHILPGDHVHIYTFTCQHMSVLAGHPKLLVRLFSSFSYRTDWPTGLLSFLST